MADERNEFENYDNGSENDEISKEVLAAMTFFGAVGGGVALGLKEFGGKVYRWGKEKIEVRKAEREIKKEEYEKVKLKAKERAEAKRSVEETEG